MTARIMPPRIPRAQWASHPRFPDQVLLVGSHDNFRRINRLLIEQAERREGKAVIGAVFRRWISAMRSHEAYEEHKLYPYLAKRWGQDFTPSKAGHIALHGAYDAVIRALSRDETDDGDWEQLAAALRSHDEILNAHLDIEEDAVVPLLLELSPREFERYLDAPADVLLAELDERPETDS